MSFQLTLCVLACCAGAREGSQQGGSASFIAWRGCPTAAGEVTAEAKALRRHIDFVIPVGLEPAAEEFEVEVGDLHPAQVCASSC